MNQNILKGLLVILVIVDHNDFARSVIPDFLRGLSFHVVGFMMLPFLRPPAAPDRAFVHYLLRLYYPFFAMATAMAVLTALTRPVDLSEHAALWALALYSGHFGILNQVTGMALLWFLPAFVSMVALRSLIEHAPAAARAAAIAALVALHPFIGVLARHLAPGVVPLGLLPALYVIPLAYLGVFLHRRGFARLPRGAALALSAALFAIVKAAQMHFGFSNEVGFAAVAGYTRPLALLLNDGEAITGVLMLFQASRYPLGRLVEDCGRHSLQLYLFHGFVAYALFKLVLALGSFTGSAGAAGAPLLFLGTTLATVLLTLLAARVIGAQPLLMRLLFPRSLRELRHFWRRSGTASAVPAPGRDGAR